MKRKPQLLCLICLIFFWALPATAHTLTVSPQGPVQPGDTLTFTAVIDAVDLQTLIPYCQNSTQPIIIWYFVRTPDGHYPADWMTELYKSTMTGPGLPATVTFSAKYIVPPGASHLSFYLYGHNDVCFDNPYEERIFDRVDVTVIARPDFFLNKKLIPVLKCYLEPGCTFCAKIDLSKVKTIIRPNLKESLEVRLVYRGRQVAVLGRVGGRENLPKHAVIRLKQAEMDLLRRRERMDFTLVFVSGKKTAGERAVRLSLK